MSRAKTAFFVAGALLASGSAAAPARTYGSASAPQRSASILEFAQETRVFQESWRWGHFTVDSGLPSNDIQDVVETSDGTVWAATRAGVAWFDEFRWHPVGPDAGIPARAPRMIAAHGADRLWVIIEGNLYSGNRDGFTHVAVRADGADVQVRSVFDVAGIGTLLLGARAPDADGELFHYQDGIATVEPTPDLPWGPQAALMWVSEGGSVWLNAMGGLQRLEGDGWGLTLPTPAANPLTVSHLVEGRNGGLASITYPDESRGLWAWSNGGLPQRLPDEPTHLLQSMDIGPDNGAVAVYRSGDVRLRVAGEWGALSPIPPQMINAMVVRYRDNGDLWVGTQRGLFLFRRSDDRWAYWKVDSPDGRNEVSELLRTRDGSIWLGTAGGLGIRRPDGAFTWIPEILGVELGLVTGLVEDDNGHIWISSGSAFAGAFRFDGSEWVHFGEAQGLQAPRIHRIRKDDSGRLWFLGMAPMQGREPRYEPGAFVYDGDVFTRWGVDEGLLDGRVYDFAQSAEGALWFATAGGISRWHDNGWTHWTSANGLRRTRIFTLASGHDGRLWFGDQNDGLGYIDDGDVPGYYTTDDGLVDNRVQDLAIDRRGALWVATRGGLTCYHNGTWLSFDSARGLNNPNLWPVLPGDDEVYVGTTGTGVNVLSLRETSLPSPVVDIDEAVVEERTALLRWRVLSYWGMQSPDDIETRFRIDGDDWSPWSTRHETTAPSLASGTHTLEVQAKGLFGEFESTTASAPVIIPPPLYLRPGFVGPVGALTLAVIALLSTIIARRRRHALTLRRSERNYRRELEHRVEERTRALRESEERLRMLLETTKVIPWESDARTWEFTYVGPQAEQILGYPAERWYEPDFWTAHIHPDDVDYAIDYCADHANANLDYEFDYRMIAANGEVVWLHDLVSVVSEGGEPVKLLGFMIDVTERKRAESERIEAESEAHEHRERLAHLSRVNMLGELATGIAHEVNQPLTAVSTYTQASRRMIEAGAIDQNELLDVLARISDEAVRAGDMIHHLRDLVRKRESERETCDVNELVADVVRLADIEARDRGVDIELDLDATLPTVWVDTVQIQQVILNLVRNAIEAVEQSANGRNAVHIATRSAAEETIEISVEDSGPGVHPDAVDRLFEPFFSTKGAGMGMGLSISRTIVEAHEGRIGYRRNESGGTTFYFTLAGGTPEP